MEDKLRTSKTGSSRARRTSEEEKESAQESTVSIGRDSIHGQCTEFASGSVTLGRSSSHSTGRRSCDGNPSTSERPKPGNASGQGEASETTKTIAATHVCPHCQKEFSNSSAVPKHVMVRIRSTKTFFELIDGHTIMYSQQSPDQASN